MTNNNEYDFQTIPAFDNIDDVIFYIRFKNEESKLILKLADSHTQLIRKGEIWQDIAHQLIEVVDKFAPRSKKKNVYTPKQRELLKLFAYFEKRSYSAFEGKIYKLWGYDMKENPYIYGILTQ